MKKWDVSASAVVFLSSVMLLVGLASGPGQAKHAEEQENVAVIIGNAGESYPIYGSGGIKVSGGHHGFFTSNMKSSQIEIDGSGIGGQKFLPIQQSANFSAAGGSAYFVLQTVTCTLPPAETATGQEIIVCNANDGTTISYQTMNNQRLLSAGPATNSITGKMDRFISDGKGWYKE